MKKIIESTKSTVEYQWYDSKMKTIELKEI